MTDGTAGGTVWGLAVSGSDLYAGGFVYGDVLISPDHHLINPVATYWKNGVQVALTDGTHPAVVHALTVSGGVLYAAGFEAADEVNGNAPYIAKYWRDGVPVVLTPNTLGARAKAITVVGTDVYVAGFEDNGRVTVAKYWKNGVPVYLSTDGTHASIATAIAVGGQDVYVSGSEHNGRTWVAKVWKNGVSTALTDGTQDAEALAMVVVRR